MSDAFSLAPGFSPVVVAGRAPNRFNGLLYPVKPLKRLGRRAVWRHPAEAGC
jgi:hypothetical protein